MTKTVKLEPEQRKKLKEKAEAAKAKKAAKASADAPLPGQAPMFPEPEKAKPSRGEEPLPGQRKLKFRTSDQAVTMRSGELYRALAAVSHAACTDTQIMVDGSDLQVGNFTSVEAAARAYDRAARKHFGEFARLNFPEEV